MTVLEDLIKNAAENYPPELRDARAVPVDPQATADLKADSDRWAKLAELAEVEVEQAGPDEEPHGYLADASVRGANVTFAVIDADGAPSYGFFPLTALAGSSAQAKKAAARGRMGGRPTRIGPPTRPGRVTGGTASTPSVTQPDGPKPPGVPANIDDLNAKEVVALLRSPTDGTDPHAIAQYERDRGDDARPSVIKEAEKRNLFAAAPQTPQSDPQGAQPVADDSERRDDDES